MLLEVGVVYTVRWRARSRGQGGSGEAAGESNGEDWGAGAKVSGVRGRSRKNVAMF